MKMRNTKALLLAVMMLASMLLMCACAGDATPTTGGNGGTEPTSANAVYKVTLADAIGTAYNSNIVVSFLQNGEPVGMQPVDANGVAAKELPRGEYTIELTITDGKTYHYDASQVKLTAETTEATLTMANMPLNDSEELFHNDEYHHAPYVEAGCTYLELTGGVRNYCIFTPKQSGVYTVTLHNAEGEVGYYGGTFFVLDHNAGTVVDGGIELSVSNGQIGTDGDGGTTKMVIGIDVAEGVTDCVLSIARTSDYKPTPQESEWVNYFSAYNPVKYALPEGLAIQEFDLTSSYTLVLNPADGFYHLNTVDGPIVLVRMNAELSYGGCFGAILSNANVGVYEYDEDGNFTQRVSFNSVLHKYLGDLSTSMGSYKYENTKLDDAYGVYPLNEDLMYIIQTYGTFKGWWDRESDNYLFAGLPGVNVESAWLFMCCYAQ